MNNKRFKETAPPAKKAVKTVVVATHNESKEDKDQEDLDLAFYRLSKFK